ncbi:MAG TPA: bifunctional DNA primase/polymerase [Polyangiaceae bacterium]
MTTVLSPNGRAALAYAERGIAVFPVCPATKIPYARSHGELDGTVDPTLIEQCWRKRPDPGIGAALRFTAYFVLDIDARAFGDEWLGALELEHGKLPETATAISGSGCPSMHLWFRRTPELEGITCTKLCPGVDVKGLRYGFVLLPPSRHPSGKNYTWEASSRIDAVPIADPPAWLVNAIRRKATRRFVDHQHPNAVDPESFYLGRLFKKANLLIRQVRHGVFSVRCPNEDAHSQKSGAASTVLFAPKKPGGRARFTARTRAVAPRCSGEEAQRNRAF